MSDHKAGSPPRRQRLLAVFVVLLLGVVALGLAFLWFQRRDLASTIVHTALTDAGVRNFGVEIADVGLSRMLVRTIWIGDAVRPDMLVEDLELTFSPAGLLAGRVDGIDVGSLKLEVQVHPDGVFFGELAPLIFGEISSAPGGFSVGDISIDDLHVTVSLPQGVVALAGGIQLLQRDGGMEIHPADGCLGFFAASLQAGAGVLDDISGDVCLADRGTGLAWPLNDAFSVTVTGLPLVVRGDDGGILLEADLPNISVGLEAGDHHGLAVRVEGGRISLPGFGLALSDADLQFILDDVGPLSGTWRLARASLRDLSPALRFAPVHLTGDGHLGIEDVAFELLVSDPQSLVRLLSIEGRHAMASGTGSAVVRVGPLAFQPDGLQPQNLVPPLKGTLALVSGEVQGEGRFGWTPGTLTSEGVLNLEDLALSTHAARIEGVSGVVTFEHLLPPVTAPDQSLSVGLVDAGFRLLEGNVDFAIRRGGEVQIEHAQWPFAGGVISLSSGLIEPGAVEQALELSVTDVDLASLVALLNIDGLSGSGTVTGRIPIVIRDGDPIIVGGRLVADGGGQLSYRGAGTGALEGGQSALLFEALEDFRYTSLTLSLDGNAQGKLTLKLSLKGANPEVYNGYPFAINVNTEASFAELVRSATVSMRALDIIRESGAVGQPEEMETRDDK